MHGVLAGRLSEERRAGVRTAVYSFEYEPGYAGPPVSLALPLRRDAYRFDRFPPFFDGLLPEGWQLEALLRQAKLDRTDLFGQLLAVGADPVGAVTVEPLAAESPGAESADEPSIA